VRFKEKGPKISSFPKRFLREPQQRPRAHCHASRLGASPLKQARRPRSAADALRFVELLRQGEVSGEHTDKPLSQAEAREAMD